MSKSDLPDYRTDLVTGDRFFIYSYPGSGAREQEFRDRFRQWTPPPAETTAAINGIRYDRYESRSGGNTTVAYLVRTNSANERGYISVLVFTAHDNNPFELADFENIVGSFRYSGIRSAGSWPGDDIPLYDESGKPIARKADGRNSRMFDTSDWDTAGGDYSGESSASESSSGSGSSGGGGCQR